MTYYKELHLNKESLDAYELPDIGYPIQDSSYNEVAHSGGKIDLKKLLFWLQEYSSLNVSKWNSLETAIFRLAVLLAPEDKRRQIRVYGDNWFLVCGTVDLDQKIITIQRQEHLVAAINLLKDGQLCVCSYRPLDAASARYLIRLSRNADPDVGMTNWEYAKGLAEEPDSDRGEKGEAYLKSWEFGLGMNADNSPIEPWYSKRKSVPVPHNLSAMQLGVCYEYSSNL